MGLGPCVLLLLLIGTVPSRRAANAAEIATSPRSLQAQQRAWSGWPLLSSADQRDQRTLGVCLHMYLERDFPEIERIVYPVTKPPRSATATAADSEGDRFGGRVLVDGPGLEANCQQLYRLVNCFSRSLGRMQYYENFSEFRRLTVALNAVLLQLCGAVDMMRHRFLPLLQTLNCIEKVRARSTCPYKDRLPPNVWHQLIRLEADSSLCWPLMRQLHCVRDSGSVRANCGNTAQDLFANLSAVFLGHWCLSTGATLSQIPFILKTLPFFLALLPVFSIRFSHNVSGW